MRKKSFTPFEDVVTLCDNKWRKKLYGYFHHMKLSSRITLSNIVLYTLLIAVTMHFVSIFTSQFLFMKNREDLMTKKDQIEDMLEDEQASLKITPKALRFHAINEKLKQYYIVDNYQTMILVFDSLGSNSYSLNKEMFDSLFLSEYKISPKNIEFQVIHHEDPELNLERLNINVFSYVNANEKIKFSNATLKIPCRFAESFIEQTKFLGNKMMYTSVRYDSSDGYSAYVLIFLDPEIEKSFLLSLNSALIISSVLGILFLTLFGRLFTRRALRPLVDLSHEAQKIDNAVLSYRIPSNQTNDEVDTLIKSLNLMLQNLEQSFDYQKRFVSDASHELRIPLTIVLGYIDLLKTMGYDDEALLKESLDSIESEAINMKNLVEKLLLIARLENNRITLNMESIQMVDFFDKIAQECHKLYPDYHFEYALDYKESIYSDYELLTQVIRALSENAVKYSKPNTTITFSTRIERQYVEISVKDQGVGIKKEDIPKLTNRFYRLSEDRNRKTGGAGLGLSITDSLVKALGGFMRIESDLGKGTHILLYFPLVDKHTYFRQQL